MRGSVAAVSFAAACCLASIFAQPVLAECPTPASAQALQEFTADPAKWMKANKGHADIGDELGRIAAAAVNAKNPAFGRSLYVALGRATGDDGTKIGAALHSLSNLCGSPSDGSDRGDKLFIADNILPNLTSNTQAMLAFGSAEPQTASTGDGGGGGGGANGGVGTSGPGPQSGGTNVSTASSSASPVTTPTTVVPLSISLGGISATQGSSSGTTGSAVVR